MKPVESIVTAVISDAADRVLLCQQSQGHRLWHLPGGRIRHGESPMHAAIRDIREEAGLETEMVNVVGIYQLSGDGYGDGLPDVVVYVFRARLEGGEAAVNAPGRICRLAWYDTAALPEPMTATTRTAIADAVAGTTGILRVVERDPEPEVPDAEPEPSTMDPAVAG